jgi:hypothetical protein
MVVLRLGLDNQKLRYENDDLKYKLDKCTDLAVYEFDF